MANMTKKVVLEPAALVILSNRFGFLADDTSSGEEISVTLTRGWSFIEEIGQLPLFSESVLEECPTFFSEFGEYDGGGGRTGPSPAK
jgi:hypothetical protein